MNDNHTYFENQILDAIEAIVTNMINSAPFDRTIQGTVIELLDESIGKYRIKYQDSFFDAYSKNLNIKYNKNTLVQILVPQSDMSQVKIILNTVQEDTFEDTAINTSDYYSDLTANLFVQDASNNFALCSKDNTRWLKQIYVKDADINVLDFKEDLFREGLKEANGFSIVGMFQTKLEQTGGNYGVKFTLNFKNDAGNIYTKDYIFDINKMAGKPYNFTIPSQQRYTFELGELIDQYDSIQSIIVFANGFTQQDPTAPDDIWIKNLELYTTAKLTEEQLRSNTIVINKSKPYFNIVNSDPEEEAKDQVLNIQAQAYKGKRAINTMGQNYEYYWFQEDPKITTQSESYVNYGGIGWSCINLKDNGEYIIKYDNIDLNKDDNIHFRNKHKIVIAVDNQVFAIKEFDIYNYAHQNEMNLSIASDDGVTFYYNNGNPNLTLLKDGQPLSTEELANSTFIWKYVDQMSNESYEIDNNSAVLPANKTHLEDIDINDAYIYSCAWYKADIWQGSAELALENKGGEDVLSQYYIDIDKDTFVYSYSNQGISPAHEGLLYPMKINPLIVNLKDPEKQNIDPDNYQITWTINPSEDKRLIVPLEQNENEKNKFYYTIADIYNYRKTNNNKITATIIYKNYTYTKDINFNFIKDGEPGYNQDAVFCKIYPNTEEPLIDLPSIIIANGVAAFNFTPIENASNFIIKLWDGGNYIEDSEYTVRWEILKRFTGVANEAPSCLSIVNNQVVLTENLEFDTDDWELYNNIIKATITYQGKEYYCSLPIITINLEDDDYNLVVNPDTGYRYVQYSNSGKNPEYDNSTPFEIDVLDNNDEIITENVNINWDFTNTTLQEDNGEIIPLPSYHGEDIYSTAIYSEVQLGNEVIGEIHIPIHMYLDKFSIAALDSWDGNSIVLDDQKNIILSPQVIAGSKDSSGYFSGVFVGDLSQTEKIDPNDPSQGYTEQVESGLFGYKNGSRTFEINSNTGEVILGSAQGGQMKITPGDSQTGASAIIEGGGFIDNAGENGQGMRIDLSEPSITWGNHNFMVDSQGNLTANNASINGAIVGGKGILTNLVFNGIPSQSQILGGSTDFSPEGYYRVGTHYDYGMGEGWTEYFILFHIYVPNNFEIHKILYHFNYIAVEVTWYDGSSSGTVIAQCPSLDLRLKNDGVGPGYSFGDYSGAGTAANPLWTNTNSQIIATIAKPPEKTINQEGFVDGEISSTYYSNFTAGYHTLAFVVHSKDTSSAANAWKNHGFLCSNVEILGYYNPPISIT